MHATRFSLAAGGIHLWSLSLELPPAILARCRAVLPPGELTRAAAFRFERDRDHFIAARGALREILGGYVQQPAAALALVTGGHGKPRLAGPAGAPVVQFNLSHSHGQALVAVARGRELGVDLEAIRADVDCAGIVRSCFSPGEQAAWTALPAEAQRPAFFRAWVMKEAYVKARGDGLAHDSRVYTVDLAPNGTRGLVADTLDPTAPARWKIRLLEATPGFAAALAFDGPPADLGRRGWPE